MMQAAITDFRFDFYITLVCMVGVLLLGRFIIARVKLLRDFNLPEPVVGGIVISIVIFIAYKFFNFHIIFDESLKEPLMLGFFSSIGLSADFNSLKKGGKILVVFLIVVCVMLFVQNGIGIGLALGIGIDPLIGLIGGSITMSGGHGTGLAWSQIFSKSPYLLENAQEIAIVAATFGLVMGGFIGGPVARFLIHKNNLIIPNDHQSEITEAQTHLAQNFETPQKERLITTASFLESLALIAICLLVGTHISQLAVHTLFQSMPTFVWCLFCGIFLRNVLSLLKIHQVFDREVSVLGNVSLALFLAISFLSIEIWKLADIALPLAVILIAQTITMIFYAVFVTFRFCGRNYDAAVFAAGHCGFGLGAMPTAMVNMQAITNHYGPSHIAFMVVPLVGAFFIDIVNLMVVQGFLRLPVFQTQDVIQSVADVFEYAKTMLMFGLC